jgi:hypothetical protein
MALLNTRRNVAEFIGSPPDEALPSRGRVLACGPHQPAKLLPITTNSFVGSIERRQQHGEAAHKAHRFTEESEEEKLNRRKQFDLRRGTTHRGSCLQLPGLASNAPPKFRATGVSPYRTPNGELRTANAAPAFTSLSPASPSAHKVLGG